MQRIRKLKYQAFARDKKALVEASRFQILAETKNEKAEVGALVRKILIVEDDEMSRDMLERRLRRAGFKVCGVSNAETALAFLQDRHPDLILMDILLDEMNGLEATRLIKRDPRTADIPVFALTAYDMFEYRRESLGAGCDEFETKPVHLPRLLDKIGIYLDAP